MIDLFDDEPLCWPCEDCAAEGQVHIVWEEPAETAARLATRRTGGEKADGAGGGS